MNRYCKKGGGLKSNHRPVFFLFLSHFAGDAMNALEKKKTPFAKSYNSTP
jgi:hypothetical protein